jgi:hypothetical protein
MIINGNNGPLGKWSGRWDNILVGNQKIGENDPLRARFSKKQGNPQWTFEGGKVFWIMPPKRILTRTGS